MSRINFTGRKRITRDRIRIEARSPDSGGLDLRLRLDLDGFGDVGSTVVVEAYRQASTERLVLSSPAASIDEVWHLDTFGDGAGVGLRVKVVDREGLILASADRLRPDFPESDAGDSLLPVRPSDDLGELTHRLDLSGDEPILAVNSGIGDWRALVGSPAFQTLAFPSVLREIARWALRSDLDGGDAIDGWRLYLEDLNGQLPDGADPDESDAWIDEAVDVFGRRHALVTTLGALLT